MSGGLPMVDTGLPLVDSQSTGPATQIARPNLQGWSDWAGMVASVGCAIHCAAMPFVIAYLPALGLSFLADEAFHKWMAGGCFLIALLAFVPGFRKHGRLTPLGGIVLVFAHLLNRRYGCLCGCCEGEQADAAA